MTAQKNDALQRAVANLGAVEVAPNRYAYRPWNRPGISYRIGDSLAVIAQCSDDEQPLGVEMPVWWEPEQQTWCRSCDAAVTSPPIDCGCHDDDGLSATERCHHIAADLETGAEVPA